MSKNDSPAHIFLSHAHEDRRIARQLEKLLDRLCRIANAPKMKVFYSSNLKPGEGMGAGEWRRKINREIEQAKLTVAIVTPDSNEKPWIAYESGLAIGGKKNLVPILFFMNTDALHSVYRNQQTYEGENLQSMKQCCHLIITTATGITILDENVELWDSFVQEYLGKIQDEKNDMYFRSLFRDQFHNAENACAYEGDWFAKWTELKEDGTEVVFEKDRLHCWTTANRIRFVGYSQKRGTEESKYPMEGIVSPERRVALSYWSEKDIPICGTCLLKPRGAKGDILIGNWQGFTARHIDEDPTFTRGRVVLSKREEVVDKTFEV